MKKIKKERNILSKYLKCKRDGNQIIKKISVPSTKANLNI